MRMVRPANGVSAASEDDLLVRWLHQDTTMFQVQEIMAQEDRKLSAPAPEWRFELRVRYLPTDLEELYERDKVTFCCYYDQVRLDYLEKDFESVDLDLALQLCCVEIQRFFKDLSQKALDKKSNMDYLEREVGLRKFLPRHVLDTQKPKALRKLIQTHFKRYAGMSDRECMFKFFEVLKSIYRFDQERFACALGVSECRSTEPYH